MNRIPRLCTWALSAALAALSVVACGDAAPTSGGKSGAAATKEPDPAREKRGLTAYQAAHVAEPSTKVAELLETAHVFWDTDAGTLAWEEALLEMVNDPGDDPERAVAELQAFGKKRPDSLRYLNAHAVVAGAFLTVAAGAPNGSAYGVAAGRLRPQVIQSWVSEAARFASHPEHTENRDVLVQHGDALMAAGRWSEAEVALARIEALKTPAPAIHRIPVLIRRAEICRAKMNLRDRALELFKLAETLTPALDVRTDDVQGRYIRDAIKELEAETGGTSKPE